MSGNRLIRWIRKKLGIVSPWEQMFLRDDNIDRINEAWAKTVQEIEPLNFNINPSFYHEDEKDYAEKEL